MMTAEQGFYFMMAGGFSILLAGAVCAYVLVRWAEPRKNER